MNITILNDHISSIPYISQVPSTSPTAKKIHINTYRNIYVVSIENEDPSLTTTVIQLLQDKQKCARSSLVLITLAWRRLSALTSLEEQRALFDQSRPILEPTFHHHEVFSTTTLRNLQILDIPSRYPTGLTGSKVNFHNMKKTAPLVSSLLPFPVKIFQAQPESSDPF